jgi:hypothetical protein
MADLLDPEPGSDQTEGCSLLAAGPAVVAGSSPVKQVAFKVSQPEHHFVRPVGDFNPDPRIDDFSKHDLMISIPNRSADPAEEIRWDWLKHGNPLHKLVSHAAQGTILLFDVLEEGESQRTLLLSQQIQREFPGRLDDAQGRRILFKADHELGRLE